MNAASTQSTIEHLRSMFARFGLPKVMVTDNGSCFTSSDFAEFARRNQIRHLRTAPYHPSSNGLAERAVQVRHEEADKWYNPNKIVKILVSLQTDT